MPTHIQLFCGKYPFNKLTMKRMQFPITYLKLKCKQVQLLVLLSICISNIFCSCKSENSYSQKKLSLTKFYQKVQNFKGEGIPTANEIDSISPFISSYLKTLLLTCLNKEKCNTNSNESNAPLIEGSLFCSLFEGYTSVIDITQDSIDNNRLYITFQFSDSITIENDGSRSLPFVWSDRAAMIYENKRWVVDDIDLLGNWQFGLKGSVKKILATITKINLQ